MTSITVNLTLEQVLEFVQNLPLEYKQAAKEKLEKESKDEIARKVAIVEELGGSLKVDLSEDFDYKTEYRKLIIKKYCQDDEIKEDNNNDIKQSVIDEIAGIIKDDNLPNYKTLRDESIIENYKKKN